MTISRRRFVAIERRLARTVTREWCTARIADREAIARRAREALDAPTPIEELTRPPRNYGVITRERALEALAELAEAMPGERILYRHLAARLGVSLSSVGPIGRELRRAGLWPRQRVPMELAAPLLGTCR